MDKNKQLPWLYELYLLGQSQMLRETPSIVQQQILQHIIRGFGADTGSLALCDTDDCQEMTIVAGTGLPENTIGSNVKCDESLLGWVMQHGEPVLLTGDIKEDARFSALTLHHAEHRVSCSMCWPLKLESRVLGALCINRGVGSELFTQTDLEEGTLLVNLISIVIENVKLHIDQQEAHRQALQSREHLEQILSALDNVVWSITPDTFETLFLNPAAEKVYGRPIADFMSDPDLWFETVHPDDRKRVGACLPEILEKGVLDIEYRIVRPDGEVRWIHDHIHAIFDEYGKAASLNGLGTDITNSREAETRLKKSHAELQDAYAKLQDIQSQLLQSEKMASIGQLAAGVAHEINNPIGYVYSNLGSLQKYLGDVFTVLDAYARIEPLLSTHADAMNVIQGVKQKADLEFLREDVSALMSESREGITRVKKIVQDLKDFSHVGSEEEWQPADLHHGIDSTLNIVNNEIKYKAEVKKEYADIPEVECLPPQLNQVFMNLLVNAAHAIEERGTITIRTGAADNMVWVEVSDNGKGIAPENLSRIFDPFFTTKPVGTGTGLGLSVSYSIIQKHHGSINVASEVGKGTTFRISLPVKQPLAAESEIRH
jgi:two-component system, NtrC family, sensor kinase